MNILDLRTVLLSYVISNAICAAVMASLWLQNRGRSPELGFWLADFVMQFLAVLLIVLRGIVPDFIAIVVGGGLVIGGTLLLYIGLERFVGKPSSQLPNYVLLAVFVLVHAYFAFAQPSLLARNLNLSIALLAICAQCAWLLLRRVDVRTRPTTRMVGVIFATYSLVSVARVYVDATVPPGNNMFRSGLYDTLVVLTYQMLFIGLTFALFLMVHRRLLVQMERDVVERKLAEQSLKKSEEKFAIVLHNIPDAIVITSIDSGKIVQVNESFFRLSELSNEEIVGKTTVELNLWGDPADRDRFAAELQRHGKVMDFETTFRRKSGLLLDGLVSSGVIQLPEGDSVLTVIRDVTERKRQEEEIQAAQSELRRFLAEADHSRRALLSLVEDRKAGEDEIRKLNAELEQRVRDRTAQLESANKELETFVYSVSHDLRAPLRGIDGWSLALLEDYHELLDARARQYLERVRTEAQRMGQLIDALLSLSRVTRAEMRKRPVDLSALAQTVVARLKEAQPERQVEVLIEPNLTAHGDARLLEIVLTNLLENAWKFTSGRSLARIEFGQTEAEGRPVFCVRDNGAGFDMASAGKLFGAFQRMHSASEFPGTGIGLATVQRIIHRHGGRVWAEAQVGQGATCYFSLNSREAPGVLDHLGKATEAA